MKEFMKGLLARFLMVLVCTVVMVFLSEKVYWYTQGYGPWDLVVTYFPATFVFVWALGQFEVTAGAA